MLTHYIHPVNVIHGLQIEMTKVPVASRSGKRDYIVSWLFLVISIEFLQEGNKICSIIWLSPTIICTRVFL